MHDKPHDKRGEGATVAEAARILGISEGAVRKRVERRKLTADHTADGRLVVYLDPATAATDTTRDKSLRSRDKGEDAERYARGLEEQVAYLRAQVEHLHGQLEREQEIRTEERRRHDTVIAQLSRANQEQARTIRELEAPQEASESPERSRRARIEVNPGRGAKGARRA